MKNLLAILICSCSIGASAINPSREYPRTPEIFGIQYSEYKVRTPDNLEINVWDYSSIDNRIPNRIIILVGTDAGNISFLIWQAKALREKGLHVIAFDYRGFGESSDFEINRDMLFYTEFAVDLDSVIRNTRAKYPNQKIGLYGMSMGTHISLLRKEKIDFFIGDGFYHNPKLVIERINQTKNKVISLPSRASKLRKLKPSAPILLFCSTEDKITSTADAQDFARRNVVEIIYVQGEHLGGFRILTKESFGDLYSERIIEFLERHNL